MDYSKFLQFLSDHMDFSVTNRPRHMIQFINKHHYDECVQQLHIYKRNRPSLRLVRSSSLIHALFCPLKVADLPRCYHNLLTLEEDDQISVGSLLKTTIKEQNPGIPWGVKQISAPEAWQISTGHQVRIGVIDTGADFNHNDLRHCLTRGINLLNRTSLPYDDNGHGTHIAGTIAAAGGADIMTGVAPRSIISPVKAFDQNGSAYVSDIVLGIDWCLRNNMNIINMSFGMKTKSRSLLSVVNKANQAGVVIVASSGNDKKRRGADYPARYPQTISVGATDKNQKIAGFSNRGPYVDIYAPGDKIYSSWVGGKHHEMSGTSMATSHVSGAIALLLAHRPGLQPSQIKALLRRTSRPLAYGARYKAMTKGAGEVNALRLLRSKLQINAKSRK